MNRSPEMNILKIWLDRAWGSWFISGRGLMLLLCSWVSLALQWALSMEAQKPKGWVLAVGCPIYSPGGSVGILHCDHCGWVCEDVKQGVPLCCAVILVCFSFCVSPNPLSAHASHNESHSLVGTNHPQPVKCSGEPLPLTCHDGCHPRGADAALGQPWEVPGQGI